MAGPLHTRLVLSEESNTHIPRNRCRLRGPFRMPVHTPEFVQVRTGSPAAAAERLGITFSGCRPGGLHGRPRGNLAVDMIARSPWLIPLVLLTACASCPERGNGLDAVWSYALQCDQERRLVGLEVLDLVEFEHASDAVGAMATSPFWDERAYVELVDELVRRAWLRGEVGSATGVALRATDDFGRGEIAAEGWLRGLGPITAVKAIRGMRAGVYARTEDWWEWTGTWRERLEAGEYRVQVVGGFNGVVLPGGWQRRLAGLLTRVLAEQ